METALSPVLRANSAGVMAPLPRYVSSVMPSTYTRRKFVVKSELRSTALSSYTHRRINPPMVERRIYLKEWRQAAGKTQAQVVASLEMLDDPQLPTTSASLSRLENGKQPYSQRVLLALSDIYGCEPWELIGRNPQKEGEVIDLVRRLNEREQERVRAYIEGIKASNQ